MRWLFCFIFGWFPYDGTWRLVTRRFLDLNLSEISSTLCTEKLNIRLLCGTRKILRAFVDGCLDRLTEIVFICVVYGFNLWGIVLSRSQGLGPRHVMNCCECHKIYARVIMSLCSWALWKKRSAYISLRLIQFLHETVLISTLRLPQSKSQILFHGCGYCW